MSCPKQQKTSPDTLFVDSYDVKCQQPEKIFLLRYSSQAACTSLIEQLFRMINVFYFLRARAGERSKMCLGSAVIKGVQIKSHRDECEIR